MNLKNLHKKLLLNLYLALRYKKALNKTAVKATSVHFRIFNLKTFGSSKS